MDLIIHVESNMSRTIYFNIPEDKVHPFMTTVFSTITLQPISCAMRPEQVVQEAHKDSLNLDPIEHL